MHYFQCEQSIIPTESKSVFFDFMQIASTLIYISVSAIFSIAAWYKKWLTFFGAIAAAVIGVLILTAGGWRFAFPMLFFFVTGSLFGKLQSFATIRDEKSKKPRDHIQVLCNGGIAAALCLVYLYK